MVITLGAQFTEGEAKEHINVLELKAALFGLQSLCTNVHDSHILMKLDNTSAVAGINKTGSTRSIPLDLVGQQIWRWAQQRNNWLLATHIPGILNVEADRESRDCETRTEWVLNKGIFNYVIGVFYSVVDLFASRINA